jgi:hypothetical protein
MAKGIKTGGRQKGSVNKLTSSFKELVQATYESLEADGNGMLQWANDNKTEFYKIASKLIPTEMAVKAEITQIEISKTVLSKKA